MTAVVVTATSHRRGLRFEIDGRDHWFKVVADPTGSVTFTDLAGDAAICFLFPVAMREGRPLAIRGAVSRTLLEGVESVIRLFAGWWPAMHAIDVTVTDEVDDRADTPVDRSALLFSGGIDSLHAATSSPIPDGLVFVHGHETSLDVSTSLGRSSLRTVRDNAHQMGRPLVEFRAEIADLVYRRAGIGKSTGPRLAGFAHAISGTFGHVRIAGADGVNETVPSSQHRLVEPVLVSGRCEIDLFGLGLRRFDKIGVLVDRGVDLSRVRVCLERRPDARNCGRCRKCVLTLLSMRIHGVGDTGQFLHDPSPLEIATVIASDAFVDEPVYPPNMVAAAPLPERRWLRAANVRHRLVDRPTRPVRARLRRVLA